MELKFEKYGFSLKALALLPWAIPHEAAHWSMSRLLGVPAIMYLDSTRVTTKGVPRWKMALIDLAPTLLSFVIAVFFVGFVLSAPLTKERGRIAILGLTYAAQLFITCMGDWRNVLRYLRGGAY